MVLVSEDVFNMMRRHRRVSFGQSAVFDAALDAEERKQDCELKALSRLVPNLRREYPQLRLCWSGDALYACGRTLQLAKDHKCNYVLVFKEGRLPALWQEFQTLLGLCPHNRLEHQPKEGVGSLLRRLAAECGRTPWQLFGGVANLARRLLESFRYRHLSDDAFAPQPNERMQYRFDSS